MKRTIAMLGIVALSLSAFVTAGMSPSHASVSANQQSVVSCGKPTDPGLIVYLDVEDLTASPEAGGIAASLVVYTPDGTEIHRLPLSTVPVFYPLGVGCTVLVNGIDEGPMIFDAGKGMAVRVTLPPDYNDALFPRNGWQRTFQEHRWAFLTDGDATHTLLVDVQTGSASDLGELVRALRGDDDGIVVVLGAALSPDESNFLLMTDRDTWLVPLDDPSQARLVPDAAVGRASYSEDGASILSVVEPSNAESQVVTERLDGSERRVLGEFEKRATAFWVPGSGGNEILVIELVKQTITLLNVASGEVPKTMNTLPGFLAARPMFSPSGRSVLLRTDADEIEWTLVDLNRGAAQVLDALRGYPYPYAPYAPGVRWLTFFPSAQPVVQPGTSVLGLDLETGEIRSLLTFDIEEAYSGIPVTGNVASSADGRFVIVNDFGKEYPRFWLLDGKEGKATLYSDRIATAVSPNGKLLIVGEPAGAEDERLWRTLIMTVDGRDVRTIAESLGRGGAWVPSPFLAK